jgi:hypothetical protein
MMNMMLVSAVTFGRSLIGIVLRPYETYRNIIDRANIGELGVVACILWFYFLLASFVKTSLFRPFLLTQQMMLLISAAGITYFLTVGLFWAAGRLFGATGSIRGFMVGWGYSLIPTVAWFFMTSLLYVLFPPPRTASTQGIVFSMLYLFISTTLLFWKVTLSYLALRFGLRLDLIKILMISSVVLPLLGLYSIGMYRLGIFRIPFI